MAGNGSRHSGTSSVDPFRELEEVIRLVHFLSRCKPSGFTATLVWVEERLEAIRESMEEMSPVRAAESDIGSPHSDQSRPFTALRNLAALCAD